MKVWKVEILLHRNIWPFQKKWTKSALEESHESFELKLAGEKDAEVYKKQMEKGRRKNFAFRKNETMWKDKLLKKMKSDELQETRESFELKWVGERYIEEYER